MKLGDKYTGIFTALITPLKDDARTVDTAALAQLIEFQLAHKVSGFLVLGGSGEYPALSRKQREIAVRATVEAVNGRVPVMAGVLETGIGECLDVSRAFIAAGVDSLLILTPFYVHGTQEGLYRYFRIVEEELQFPFAVYNIPYRTMVNCEPATVERIARDCPHMIGMKECALNFQQSLDNLRLSGQISHFMCGEETMLAGLLAAGAKGAIVAAANLLPDLFVGLCELGQAGKYEEAFALQNEYTPLLKLLFSEPNPGPMKYAMGLAGYPVGPISLPLMPPSAPLREAIKAEMQRMGLIK
ncbi:MAG: 4-hydroxy-tetrahydrodipicolinate synthase [Firmicutes bacterium]|nr:4-hydroxy-tetrahydrodipicolinate synthase [Bacillota bacterium]